MSRIFGLCDHMVVRCTDCKERYERLEQAPVWKPFPEYTPEPGQDARYLVLLVNGDFHWVGIRAYNHQRGCWMGAQDEDSHEQVWFFKPYLAKGEQLPFIPDSAHQSNDDRTILAEKRRVR